MPAKSEAQRRLMALAEHHPEELYKKNRSVLKMSHTQLHDFAATKAPTIAQAQRKARTKKRGAL